MKSALCCLLSICLFAACTPSPGSQLATLPQSTATKSASSAQSVHAAISPVSLHGSGQSATDTVSLPPGVYAARFTHSGSSNFIVYVYNGSEKDLLINEIGVYNGTRPVVGGALTFDIDADGPWSIQIQSLSGQSSPGISGRGDYVSGTFSPPSAGAWEITHSGKSNFIVYAHCAGGSTLVQNEIGPVSGSRVLSFDRGPCFWEVEADGAWELRPR